MSRRRRPARLVVASVLAVGLAAGASSLAGAPRPATITGRLAGKALASARVIAVGKARGAVSARARNGRFTLRLPASFARRGATLHIVRANGAYAGPIVLRRVRRGGASGLAVESQSAGTGYEGLSGSIGGTESLGTVRLTGGAGQPSRPLPARLTDGAGVPVDASGAPLGAGEMGLVDSPTRSANVQQGADPDRDGIVNAFDVDMNGNELLNQQDTATVGAAAVANAHPFLFSSLFVPFLPAASAGSDFSGNVRSFLTINFGVAGIGAPRIPAVSVDCQGIPWCATATVKTSDYGFPRGTPWPRDSAGYYTVGHRLGGADWDIGLLPNVAPDQIVVGTAFRFLLGSGANAVAAPLALGPYFVAPPVVEKVGETTVGSSPTRGSVQPEQPPIEVGSTTVSFTVQRPLRPPVPGAESGAAISMGRLNYGVDLYAPGTAMSPVYCPAAAFSGLSPTLATVPGTRAVPDPYGMADSADDAAPGAGRAISFSVDLAQCRDGAGSTPATPGATVAVDVFAQDAAGNQAIVQGIGLRL